jgi:hypothetical protein
MFVVGDVALLSCVTSGLQMSDVDVYTRGFQYDAFINISDVQFLDARLGLSRERPSRTDHPRNLPSKANLTGVLGNPR